MSINNNLHNALQNAFENHTEPLNESQWVRLEGAMHKRKKRRFLPFLILFMAISFTAGTTYFLTMYYGLPNQNILAIDTKTPSNSNELINQPKSAISPNNSKIIIENSSTPSSNQSIKDQNHLATNNKITYKNYKTFKYLQKISETNNDANTDQEKSTLENKDVIITKDNNFDEVSEVKKEMGIAKIETFKEKDTLYINKKSKDDLPTLVSKPTKFAFSLASGYSKMNVKVVGIENGEKLHKDTKKLFEESNKNLRTEFVSLGCDFNLFPRFKIGFSSGFQYIRISSPININYQLTEVPFWDSKHTRIIGYSDPVNPLQFNANTTNYTYYIAIPLRINYQLPINNKNEIIFTSGINLSTIAKAKGENVIINKEFNKEPGTRNIDRNRFSKFNTGMAGGIQYNRKIKNSFWIGIENIWQSNNQKYKTGYGGINNKLQGYNVNLILKYKI